MLEDDSNRLLPVSEWKATPEGNGRVKSDSSDSYRFINATLHAEFQYECVPKTIEEDLPRETDFFLRHYRFRGVVERLIDIPDRTLDRLFHSLHQNGGSLSQRARDREFSTLTDAESKAREKAYVDIFFGGK